MAEISLYAYLDKLDRQTTSATDEVIQHARHILHAFPKNVAAYRILGRALLSSSRWNEAGAALRRVLSVYPDDGVAHHGLSQVYNEQSQGDEAIWHLERAFEQDPNNRQILEALRDYYHRYKRTELPRIQLTSAVVARQHVRSGNDAAAVEMLRDTLAKSPDRLDLRVLLADALWQNDQRIEAAETALDVLDILPDALVPNRIMAELWLSEERPSDAQRFVSRLEAVDPYLAIELAQGKRADPNAYMLKELDYRRYAETILTTKEPDWLEALGVETFDAPAGRETEPSTAVTAPLPPLQLTQTDQLKLNKRSSQEVSQPIEAIFDDLDMTEPPQEPTIRVAARDLHDATPSHANIYSQRDEISDEDLPDWLSGVMNSSGQAQGPAQTDEAEADPFAWLRDTGVHVDEEAQRSRLTYDEDFDLVHSPDRPMKWMEDSGILPVDTPEQPEVQNAVETPDEEPDNDNRFGWMQEYDDLILKDDSGPLNPDAVPASQAPHSLDLTWLEDEDAPAAAQAPSSDLGLEWGQPDEQSDSLDLNWGQAVPIQKPVTDFFAWDQPAQTDAKPADDDFAWSQPAQAETKPADDLFAWNQPQADANPANNNLFVWDEAEDDASPAATLFDWGQPGADTIAEDKAAIRWDTPAKSEPTTGNDLEFSWNPPDAAQPAAKLDIDWGQSANEPFPADDPWSPASTEPPAERFAWEQSLELTDEPPPQVPSWRTELLDDAPATWEPSATSAADALDAAWGELVQDTADEQPANAPAPVDDQPAEDFGFSWDQLIHGQQNNTKRNSPWSQPTVTVGGEEEEDDFAWLHDESLLQALEELGRKGSRVTAPLNPPASWGNGSSGEGTPLDGNNSSAG
jgi:tetratricopeptide (TPR) repeat protein